MARISTAEQQCRHVVSVRRPPMLRVTQEIVTLSPPRPRAPTEQTAALERAYAGVLPPLHRVAVFCRMPPALDPRSAFVLSRIDGSLTLEDLIDVSAMPRVEVLGILARLFADGAIAAV